jgi:hypothetical protein
MTHFVGRLERRSRSGNLADALVKAERIIAADREARGAAPVQTNMSLADPVKHTPPLPKPDPARGRAIADAERPSDIRRRASFYDRPATDADRAFEERKYPGLHD